MPYIVNFASVISVVANIFITLSLAIHVFYFILIAFSKSLQKRTLLYSNHAVVANSLYLIVSMFYIPAPNPSFANPQANANFCAFTEIVWIVSHYIRMYSILLIAVYRFIAVFKIAWYRKLNESIFNLLIPLVVIWAISIGFPFASKYIFQTTYSPLMCLDGYSKYLGSTLGYFFFNYTIMTFIPTVTIIVIYVLITHKLNTLSSLLNKSRTTGSEQTTNATNQTTSDGQKTSYEVNRRIERKFANQFLIMCTFMVLTVLGLSIFQLRNVIPDYFTVWSPNGITKCIKIWVVCNMAAIPITSIYFHPDRTKFIKRLTAKIHPSQTRSST